MHDRRETLDPADWEPVRALARRIVDDAIDYTRDVRERLIWQDMPPEVRAQFQSPAPLDGEPLEAIYDDLVANMLPYPMGNIHPRFWMWYMGASNFTGALGDFLGSNLGGARIPRHHLDPVVTPLFVNITYRRTVAATDARECFSPRGMARGLGTHRRSLTKS